MNHHDFNERQLVPGALTGIRSFRVDPLGRLTGCSIRTVWKPDVNEGACNQTPLSKHLRYASWHLGRTYGGDNSPKPEDRPHRVGSQSCMCGFYAYFDDDPVNENYGGQVVGLIEGTGIATVGRKGFRSEKAKIVALVKHPPNKHRKIDALAWAIQRHNWVETAIIPAGVTALLGTIVLVVFGAFVHVLWAFPLPLAALCIWTVWSSFRELDLPVEGESVEVPWDLIERNYPDVPIYPSISAAIKAHPLSEPPALPSPETCDDFWERSA